MINNNFNINTKCLVIYIKDYNSNNDIDINEFQKLISSYNLVIKKFIKCIIKNPSSKYYFKIGNLCKFKLLINKYKLFTLVLNKTIKINQERNLIKYLKCNILDRTKIILNIFKERANTYFGKLQVKLAYLKYLSTRLVKRWSHLERQRGGLKSISGPGEKQIELDKRIIKKNIELINKKLYKIKSQKDKSQKLRKLSNIYTVSLVGYTNSGKSTLFNILTNSNFEPKQFIFSTLETYIRKVKISNLVNRNLLILDTIGFIKDIPSIILKAFESTLSEINNSNLILHVVDISDIYFNKYIIIVNKILEKILNKYIPVIQIMNKIDKIKTLKPKVIFNKNYKIFISAKYNLGIKYIFKYINKFFLHNFSIYNINISIDKYLIIKNFLYRNNFIISEKSKDGKLFYLKIKFNKIDVTRFLKKYPFMYESLKK